MKLSRKRAVRSPLCCGLALVLLCLAAQRASADDAAGSRIFQAKRCGTCHEMSGPIDAVPVEQRADIQGPPLWFAGSKFQADWLSKWLQSPEPVRRVKYGTLKKATTTSEHPALSAAETANVGPYLMGLKDPAMKVGAVEAKKLSRRVMFKAEKLFAKKQVCFGCHLYPSKQGEIGGFSGPSLVGAGQRLQLDWIYAFLTDPTRYYPSGRMPVYGDQAFNEFADDELKRLAQFVGGF